MSLGEVDGAPDETWQIIGGALQKGRRGLTGGSSLAKCSKTQRS